jgi:5'-AMP-activated protein kinase catalytic alpha subunit
LIPLDAFVRGRSRTTLDCAVAEHDITGLKVAIKILNRKKISAMGMEDKVWREIKILQMFHHPHIIRL